MLFNQKLIGLTKSFHAECGEQGKCLGIKTANHFLICFELSFALAPFDWTWFAIFFIICIREAGPCDKWSKRLRQMNV